MNKSGAKKIFISRPLKTDSPFHKLTAHGHTVTGQSLLKISYLPFKTPPPHEAIFFYSQKAIAHFLQHCPYDSKKQYGVMGRASAAVFAQLTGARPDLQGQGNQAELAAELKTKWKGLSILFPQAEKSMRSLDSFLTDHTIHNLIVYKNELDETILLEDFDIYAFTSPLNVKAFLLRHTFGDSAVFVIGKSTAMTIKKLTDTEVAYCEEPSAEGLYELVRGALEA